MIKVGLDIIDWPYLKRLRRAPRAGVVIMALVLGLTVFVDLITAVAVGVVAASLLLVRRMSELQLASIKSISLDTDADSHDLDEEEMAALEEGGPRVVLYHLDGPFTFGAAKGMARRLAVADTFDVLILDMSDVSFLDSSATLALEDAIAQVQDQDKHVLLDGTRPAIAEKLDRLGVHERLGEDHRQATRLEALRVAAGLTSGQEESADPAVAEPGPGGL